MARVYDLLMEDAPYDQWVEFTKQMINHYKPATGSILDVGCGTGEITHRLHQEGYRMTGVDLSSDMLTVAQQKDPQSKIEWINQDMTTLEGLEGYDCIISYCDVLNYLDDEQKVKNAFQKLYNALDNDGLFLFDVHSINHIQNNLSGATFAEVRDDISFIWFCDPGEKENSVIHDLTFFVRNEDSYQRFDEVHQQRGYHISDLNDWLEDAGFGLLGLFADFGEEATETGERLMFACKKIED